MTFSPFPFRSGESVGWPHHNGLACQFFTHELRKLSIQDIHNVANYATSIKNILDCHIRLWRVGASDFCWFWSIQGCQGPHQGWGCAVTNQAVNVSPSKCVARSMAPPPLLARVSHHLVPALPRRGLRAGGAHQYFHAWNHHIEQHGLRRLQGFQRGHLLVAQGWIHRHVLLERIQRGTPHQHRRLSSARETLVTRAIEENFLSRPRMTISRLTEEIRMGCLRATMHCCSYCGRRNRRSSCALIRAFKEAIRSRRSSIEPTVPC
jgi:hypothetical protein